MPTSCPFCDLDRELLMENDHSVAILDNFPVSDGHTFWHHHGMKRFLLPVLMCILDLLLIPQYAASCRKFK